VVAPDQGDVVSGAREEILARIRAALGPSPAIPDVPREYRGESGPASLDRFVERLLDYRASVHRTGADGIQAQILSLVDGYGPVLVPPGLPDGWAPPGAVVDHGLTPSELDGCGTVVTACAAACAETGTIVLDAAPGQGRRAISLVPDRHVCVVRAEQVVAGVPELVARLDPLRPLTFISGPSATSDIELHRVEGVHGPRTLMVVLVD
jgi:L-lactate dehydrogenase complex protein LldG